MGRRVRPDDRQRKRTRVPPIGQNRAADPNSPYEVALASHKAGDLPAAREAYCAILERDPDHVDAWHMLGAALLQSSAIEESMDCLERAVTLRPWHAGQLSNLGLVYRAAGRLRDAREALELAVSLEPENAETRNNLGVVLLELHQYRAAAEAFRQVLNDAPDNVVALANLGNVLQAEGRHRDALDSHRRVVAIDPSNVAAWNNLGSTLQSMGELLEAQDCFARALELDADCEEAAVNYGRTLLDRHELPQSLEILENVARRPGGSASAEYYVGKTLDALGRHDEALARYERATQLRDGYAYALVSLAFSWHRRGQFQRATSLLEEAVRCNPNVPETQSCLLYGVSLDPRMSPAQVLGAHRDWARAHGDVPRIAHQREYRAEQRPLRVGYLSPDFRTHAVMSYFMPVLRNHDRSVVETFCYAQVKNPDEVTAVAHRLAGHWRSTCGWSDEQIASMMADDQLDILVDLAGHTAHSRVRVLAYKPAPVQFTWLGYPHTTGLDAVDYYLTNITQDPPGESFHIESPVYLDVDTCFDPPASAPDVSPAPWATNHHVTFGALHRQQKISPAVLDLWAQVMDAVPTAKLLLYSSSYTSDARAYLDAALTSRGIDRTRFRIMRECSYPHYLGIYQEIDIALDVFPWNGGTTTREALWMGVPVLGLLGDRRSSRATAAVLRQIGHAELVATDCQSYVSLAAALAADGERLTCLRNCLRHHMRETICNGPTFTKKLEQVYRHVWDKWCYESRLRAENRPHSVVLGNAEPTITSTVEHV